MKEKQLKNKMHIEELDAYNKNLNLKNKGSKHRAGPPASNGDQSNRRRIDDECWVGAEYL
jgi:hypothetical protein